MFETRFLFLIFLMIIHWAVCLLPAKFQWKTIDFAWEGETRSKAIADGSYIPENNMPTGLARWQDKIFIAIPRWKKGVAASLNYIHVNGSQDQPLVPYPSWHDAFISSKSCCAPTNSTVVSAFRVTVDKCDRLWTVDNGVADMSGELKQIAEPAIFVFDLNKNVLLHKYVLSDDILKDSSVLTSIVVDEGVNCGCDDTYAYVTDMGSNAIIVFHLASLQAWRVEHPFFHFDPSAGVYRVGGVDFFWSDGVSSAALSQENKDGYRDLYLHPTSSTKQFKMSTKILRNRNATMEEKFNAVEVVGDRGPNSQATACDLDPATNILFFTQLSKNGIGCWNVNSEFNERNTPLIISDCNLLEFPNDIKVDAEGNLWILSDRQSRFLYETMDFNQVNFRILAAPVVNVVEGSPCAGNKKWLSFGKKQSPKASTTPSSTSKSSSSKSSLKKSSSKKPSATNHKVPVQKSSSTATVSSSNPPEKKPSRLASFFKCKKSSKK